MDLSPVVFGPVSTSLLPATGNFPAWLHTRRLSSLSTAWTLPDAILAVFWTVVENNSDMALSSATIDDLITACCGFLYSHDYLDFPGFTCNDMCASEHCM